jgi:hypothetical protein
VARKQKLTEAERDVADMADAADLGLRVAALLRSAPSPLLACSALSVAIAKLCVDLGEEPAEFCEKLLSVAREVRDRTEGETVQ